LNPIEGFRRFFDAHRRPSIKECVPPTSRWLGPPVDFAKGARIQRKDWLLDFYSAVAGNACLTKTGAESMEINGLIDGGMSVFRDHTLWAVLAVIVIGVFIYLKPKDMLKLAIGGLALGAVIYVFTFVWGLTSRGIDETEKFTTTPEVKVD
jgi:hypothetical protein